MTKNQWLPLGLRWTARVTGLALSGLVAMFVVGHGGLPNLLGQPVPVQIEFAGMFMMLAGFVAAWRWETFGGILATCGFASFFATEMVTNGTPPGGLIPFFAIPGVLLLVSRAMTSPSKCPQIIAE